MSSHNKDPDSEVSVFAFETKDYVTKDTREKCLEWLKLLNNDAFKIAVGHDSFGFN